jgi:hypothetical protein
MKTDIPGTNYYKKKLTNFSGTVEKVFFSRAPRRKRAGWTGFLYGPLCLGSARGHVSHSAMVHGRRAAGRAATVAPLRRGSNAFCTADISGAAGPRLPGKVWRVATDAARRTGCTYGGALCDSGGNGGTVRWCQEEGHGRREKVKHMRVFTCVLSVCVFTCVLSVCVCVCVCVLRLLQCDSWYDIKSHCLRKV